MPCKAHSISIIEIYRVNRRNFFFYNISTGSFSLPFDGHNSFLFNPRALSLYKVIVSILLNRKIHAPWSIVKLTSAIFSTLGFFMQVVTSIFGCCYWYACIWFLVLKKVIGDVFWYGFLELILLEFTLCYKCDLYIFPNLEKFTHHLLGSLCKPLSFFPRRILIM